MAVDEDSGSGQKAGIHTHAIASVDLNYDEALPVVTAAFGLCPQALQETLFELENFLDIHAHDERFGGGDGAVDEQDILELVLARRQDAGTFVDFVRIEEIEHGEVLHAQDFVHALQTQAPLAVEEIGDMGLFEAGLLRQAQTRQPLFFDTVPQGFAKVFLQDFEFHEAEYSTIYSRLLLIMSVQHLRGNNGAMRA